MEVIQVETQRELSNRKQNRLFWEQHVSAWQQSHLKPAAYAQHYQLCQQQFKRWRYRLKRESKQGRSGQTESLFIPAAIIPPAPVMEAPLIIISPNGLQLRLAITELGQVLPFVKGLLCGH